VLDELVARYRLLVDSVHSLTVVYNAGQNSHDNHAVVEQTGIGFVGCLPPSDRPDLHQAGRRTRTRLPHPQRDAATRCRRQISKPSGGFRGRSDTGAGSLHRPFVSIPRLPPRISHTS
jgi:hypothetical protein